MADHVDREVTKSEDATVDVFDIERYDLRELGQDLQRFQKDETVKEALSRGVKLKEYWNDTEKDIARLQRYATSLVRSDPNREHEEREHEKRVRTMFVNGRRRIRDERQSR